MEPGLAPPAISSGSIDLQSRERATTGAAGVRDIRSVDMFAPTFVRVLADPATSTRMLIDACKAVASNANRDLESVQTLLAAGVIPPLVAIVRRDKTKLEVVMAAVQALGALLFFGYDGPQPPADEFLKADGIAALLQLIRNHAPTLSMVRQQYWSILRQMDSVTQKAPQ